METHRSSANIQMVKGHNSNSSLEAFKSKQRQHMLDGFGKEMFRNNEERDWKLKTCHVFPLVV